MRKVLLGFLLGFFLNLGVVEAIEVGLKWSPNTESDLAGYNVYQSSDVGGPYALVGSVGVSPDPSYIWLVPPNTEQSYYWVVSAFDNVGNESGYSKEVSVYVDNKSPSVPGGVQIIIIVVPK